MKHHAIDTCRHDVTLSHSMPPLGVNRYSNGLNPAIMLVNITKVKYFSSDMMAIRYMDRGKLFNL